MSERDANDRRVIPAPGRADSPLHPGHFSRNRAWLIVVSGTALTCLVDAASSPDFWFGPFYFVMIGFAAWSLGWREAVLVGLACLATNIGSNGLSFYPFGTAAAVWNLGLRITAAVTFIWLLNHVRSSYEREWRLARTDRLTGALNRQAYFELVGASTVSYGWRILAYADLDGLKKLNDQCGHDMGDRCLSAYADHVRKVTRKRDVFARLGGDEFVAYLEVRDEAAARSVAVRLHREMNAVVSRMHPALTCSVGVLVLVPGQRLVDHETQIADGLMYEAKKQGAGLVVATVRTVRGTPFISHSGSEDAFDTTNPVLESELQRLEPGVLDYAA